MIALGNDEGNPAAGDVSQGQLALPAVAGGEVAVEDLGYLELVAESGQQNGRSSTRSIQCTCGGSVFIPSWLPRTPLLKRPYRVTRSGRRDRGEKQMFTTRDNRQTSQPVNQGLLFQKLR